MSELKRPRYWKRLPDWFSVIDIYSGPERFLSTFSAAPSPTCALLFCAHMCQSEVRNGGVHQFFFNPTGVLAPEAVAALRMMGFGVAGEVIEAGMRWFGDVYPRDQVVRQVHLDAVPGKTRDEWDPFRTLDEHFYRALRRPDGGDAFEEVADRLLADHEQGAG